MTIALDQGGAGLRWAAEVPVPAALRDWVDTAHMHPGGGDGWRIVADDASYLVFSVSANRPARLSLVGARSKAVTANHADRRFTAIVRLHAGALPAVASIEGTELVDRGAPWALVTGDIDAAERLLTTYASGGDRAVVETLLAIVARRLELAGRPPVDWRLRALIAAETEAGPVGAAQRRAGVSPRTLHRAVSAATGLKPSVVVRIRRLHRALMEAVGEGQAGSRVAARHGYADQSHLIRECRALMGETPGEFIRRRWQP